MSQPKVMPCPRCNGTKKFHKKPCEFCRGSGGVENRRMTFVSVTHVAGSAIEINGRVVQRCAWCGFKLIDALVKDQPVGKGGRVTMPFAWTFGDQVRVPIDGDQTKPGPLGKPAMHGHMNTDPFPADFCFGMVEQG